MNDLMSYQGYINVFLSLLSHQLCNNNHCECRVTANVTIAVILSLRHHSNLTPLTSLSHHRDPCRVLSYQCQSVTSFIDVTPLKTLAAL